MLDIQAFHRDYGERVFRFLVARTGKVEASEDLLHDVYARILARDNPEPITNLHGYVYRCARNALGQYWDRVTPREAELPGDEVSTAIRESARSSDLRIDLLTALRALSAADLELILMRHALGLSFAEIADCLGGSEDRARQRYRRARLRAREHCRAAGLRPATPAIDEPGPGSRREDERGP